MGLRLGKFPRTLQDLRPRSVQPHHIVPVLHDWQTVRRLAVAAPELNRDRPVRVFLGSDAVEPAGLRERMLLDNGCRGRHPRWIVTCGKRRPNERSAFVFLRHLQKTKEFAMSRQHQPLFCDTTLLVRRLARLSHPDVVPGLHEYEQPRSAGNHSGDTT